MLFQRRDEPKVGERIKVYFWPRRSWTRSVRYVLHRVSRLRATPHAIALGFSAGVFASFTPFMGCHFIIAGLLAWMMRASILASALGTFVGNPITFPFIWIGAYQLGNWVLGEANKFKQIDLSMSIFQDTLDHLLPLIKPMTIGGVPLGVLAGSVSYYLIKRVVDAYQAKKQRKRRLNSRGEPAQA